MKLTITDNSDPYVYINVKSSDMPSNITNYFKLTSQQSKQTLLDYQILDAVSNDRYTYFTVPTNPELVVNGTFESMEQWNITGNWYQSGSGVTFVNTIGGGAVISQDIGLIHATAYNISIDITNVSGNGELHIQLGDGANAIKHTLVNPTINTYTFTLTADGNSTVYITTDIVNVFTAVSFKNISVKDVLPTWLTDLSSDHINGIYDYSVYNINGIIDEGVCKLYADPGGSNNKNVHISDNENMESQIHYRPTYEI